MPYTLDTSRTSANRAIGRGGRRIRHITIHYWGRWVHQSHTGIVDWLSRKRTPGTSAHYVVSPGLVSRIVPESDTSWANGNRTANQESITIELCPDPARLEQTIATCAELVRDIRGRHGDLPLYPHRKWTSTDCPGPFTTRLGDIDRLARGQAPAPAGGASTPAVLDVAGTQTKLAALGYSPGAADGVLGPTTRAATAAYQADRGLTADGTPGPTTRTALEADMTTLDQIHAELVKIRPDIATVHNSVLRTPDAVLNARITRAGGFEGPTTLAQVVAWSDSHIVRILEAVANVGRASGVSDEQIAQITEAVAKVSAEDVAPHLQVTPRADA